MFVCTGIECMGNECEVKVPEDFLYSVLSKPDLRDRYSQLSFLDYVKVRHSRYFFTSLEMGHFAEFVITNPQKRGTECQIFFVGEPAWFSMLHKGSQLYTVTVIYKEKKLGCHENIFY